MEKSLNKANYKLDEILEKLDEVHEELETTNNELEETTNIKNRRFLILVIELENKIFDFIF